MALNDRAKDEKDRALFRVTGNLATPSEFTRGPWMPTAQHGSPPSALLQRIVEQEIDSDQWIARISIELLAPVPLTELSFDIDRSRVSRRVDVATARLCSDGRTVARATARLLRKSEPVTSEASAVEGPFPLPGPEAEREAPAWFVGEDHITFHQRALQHRWVSGDFEKPGSAVCWQRHRMPVVQGEEPTAQQRVMAVADIASGVSSVFSAASGYGMINSDLDVAFIRPAIGEWLRTDATTRLGLHGTGVCVNTLSDEHGVIAHGTQTLLGRTFA